MMSNQISDFTDYISQLKTTIDCIDQKDIELIVNLMITARDSGGSIYVFGNGDSASNALHFSADFSKGVISPNQKRFKIHCLNMNVPLMTAWSNDASYDLVFKEQLVDVIGKNDLAIGISTSGNSPNVLRAIEYANSVGTTTVALAAFDGGKISLIAKHAIIAKTNNVEIAEDIHWIVGHLIKINLIKKFGGSE